MDVSLEAIGANDVLKILASNFTPGPSTQTIRFMIWPKGQHFRKQARTSQIHTLEITKKSSRIQRKESTCFTGNAFRWAVENNWAWIGIHQFRGFHCWPSQSAQLSAIHCILICTKLVSPEWEEVSREFLWEYK